VTQLEALKEIAKRDGGLLRPQAVVDAARRKESPLHGAFCWNNTEAAEKYRLLQAQQLIRSFRVTVDDNDGAKYETPVFVGVSTDRTEGKAENPYRLADDVAKSADLQAVAESDALEQLRGIKARYEYLKRLGDIWAAIDGHGGAVRS
jgi:hypothetical protein